MPAKVEVECRPLYEIAQEIERKWRPINFAAKPYVEALASLKTINDMYGLDSAVEIVARFLGNAAQFKGPEAKALKDELNIHLHRKCDRVLPGRVL